MDFRAIMSSSFVRVKLVTIVHLTLISNAMLSNWSPQAYIFYNVFFMVSLFWALHSKESVDAVYMATLIDAVSFFLDLFCIIGYFSAHNPWSVTFAIINLVARPFSTLLLQRELTERGGSLNPAAIFPTTEQRSYEDIDRTTNQSVPTNQQPPTTVTF
ncbi:type-1 angiotensin II receptor-associated protein-like [Lutzomyia longipalpis]|uniref:Putative angiotensin 2 type i receptor-associated protein n=1 Tax=Lutzomyia longipalpis TaxID=7200 RepID=A0A1B0CWT5_LUTLO|nr:type-1 angiotensin II receptor-associated protein-like [Lutzomyia longipalpis]